LNLTEQLKDLTGMWVAVKNGEVLFAAVRPEELLRWLAEHPTSVDDLFRVEK
jgi:hypothetical protein